jgi:hypothetical protein
LSPNELADGAAIMGQLFMLQKDIHYQGRTIESGEEVVVVLTFKRFFKKKSQDLYGIVMISLEMLKSSEPADEVVLKNPFFACIFNTLITFFVCRIKCLSSKQIRYGTLL